MPQKTHAGYEKLAKWEEQFTEGKVRNLSGHYGLTAESLEDLRQELLLHLWLKRQDNHLYLIGQWSNKQRVLCEMDQQ